MNFKKLGIALCASAAFGLVACGDDSSSGTNSGTNDELKKEFEEVQKDMIAGLETLGKCTEDNAGEEKSITVKGKEYKVVCEDGEWESDELDNLIEEYEKKLADDAKKHIDGKGCNFKLEDKVWSYDISTDFYDGATNKSSMKIDGTTLIETSVTGVATPNASMVCKSMSDEDMHYTEKMDAYTSVETSVECGDNEIITTIVTTSKNALDENYTRETYFNDFMAQCKKFNNLNDDEGEEDGSSGDDGEDGDDGESHYNLDDNGYLILNKGDEIPMCMGDLIGVTAKWPNGSWMKCEIDEADGGSSWVNASDPYSNSGAESEEPLAE